MEEILFNKDYCKIYYNSEANFVHVQWFGFPKSEEFRYACDFALKIMTEKKATKFLTDNRKASLFRVMDQNWLNEDWLIRAERAGYKASATLINEDVFIKGAVSNIQRKRDKSKFKNEVFSDINEAVNWLKSI